MSAVGTVAGVQRAGDRLHVTIAAPYDDLVAGESVAVAGACLTVVEVGDGFFGVDAVVTTRGRTTFDVVEVGRRVNLERALTVGAPLGGHLVQGHVDGVGTVARVREQGDALLVDVEVAEDVAEITVPCGSITIDGVSLTANAIPATGMVQVSLIPYTREHTTLGDLREGDRVHVEADIIGKYVRQLITAGHGRSAANGGSDAVRHG